MWRGGEELRGRRGVKKAMAGKKRAEVSRRRPRFARACAARAKLRRNETLERVVRAKRESVFCIHEARPGNRANEIKHGDLHGAGSAKAFCPISNTP